jgi:hypothetical protein
MPQLAWRRLMPKRRLTNINAGPVGFGWENVEGDHEVARRIVTILEDRRVLFSPNAGDCPQYSVESVLEIRGQLRAALEKGGLSSDLDGILKEMRKACRDFLIETKQQRWAATFAASPRSEERNLFQEALANFRKIMGAKVGLLCERHNLKPESELATLIPEKEMKDGQQTAPGDGETRHA